MHLPTVTLSAVDYFICNSYQKTDVEHFGVRWLKGYGPINMWYEERVA